jgi:hypothetical protein
MRAPGKAIIGKLEGFARLPFLLEFRVLGLTGKEAFEGVTQFKDDPFHRTLSEASYVQGYRSPRMALNRSLSFMAGAFRQQFLAVATQPAPTCRRSDGCPQRACGSRFAQASDSGEWCAP